MTGTGTADAMEVVATAPAEMDLHAIGDWAARVERIGFDTIHVSETIHDPFTIAAMALSRTTRVTVRTSMALAFPRSPMIMAYSAWDLAKYSNGRFQLGIASQVRGNIVGRFSSPWSEPVARLRDYIESLRAIFYSFQTGDKLDHAGPFYKFDRLQPYFNPGPIDHPMPQIWTGGVNQKMCVLAGELADGFVCHPTNSHPRVLSTRTLPAIAEGARKAPVGALTPAVVANPQALMAASRGALDALREPRRAELAFLYSTPAYRRQLEDFGLGHVGEALHEMARLSEWGDLSKHLTDDVMNQFVVQGTYAEIPDIIEERYSGLCTGLSLPVSADNEHDRELATAVERCKAIPTSRNPVHGLTIKE